MLAQAIRTNAIVETHWEPVSPSQRQTAPWHVLPLPPKLAEVHHESRCFGAANLRHRQQQRIPDRGIGHRSDVMCKLSRPLLHEIGSFAGCLYWITEHIVQRYCC
jgi:hypothetical protein